jgi:UDP-N-acetylglucosamine 2-epimerase (non-hydrolysing)
MAKKILIVVGTRPNFIKITQFQNLIGNYPNLEIKIAHTGQHHNNEMSDVFFQQFKLNKPDFFLSLKSTTPVGQMSEIMIGLEKIMNDYKPDWVMVPGDVTSTLAGSLTANKLNIPVAHLESGLRSNDRTMPEEFNRILTDEISDLLFVTEQSGLDNLKNEHKSESKIKFVGNTMIDTLVAFEKEIEQSDVLEKYQLDENKFVLMTMHRPATVDFKEQLEKLFSILENISTRYKIVFPIHPRTQKNIDAFGLRERVSKIQGLILTAPLDYFAFQKLIKKCKFILTDSGGIQEESTFVGKPCLTLRPNTERPITVTLGTNKLIEFDVEKILTEIQSIENGTYKTGVVPPLWDGKATHRVLEIFNSI